jgi:hypothetical protein
MYMSLKTVVSFILLLCLVLTGIFCAFEMANQICPEHENPMNIVFEHFNLVSSTSLAIFYFLIIIFVLTFYFFFNNKDFFSQSRLVYKKINDDSGGLELRKRLKWLSIFTLSPPNN